MATSELILSDGKQLGLDLARNLEVNLPGNLPGNLIVDLNDFGRVHRLGGPEKDLEKISKNGSDATTGDSEPAKAVQDLQ